MFVGIAGVLRLADCINARLFRSAIYFSLYKFARFVKILVSETACVKSDVGCLAPFGVEMQC